MSSWIDGKIMPNDDLHSEGGWISFMTFKGSAVKGSISLSFPSREAALAVTAMLQAALRTVESPYAGVGDG